MGEKKETQQQQEKPQQQRLPAALKKVVKIGWVESRAHKYAKRFDTLEQWAIGHQSSYKAAVAHGWIESCTEHMTDKSLSEHLDSYKPTA